MAVLISGESQKQLTPENRLLFAELSIVRGNERLRLKNKALRHSCAD